MRASAALAELAAEVYASGNQTLTGDARSALFAAQAAAECSAGNVRANRSFITDAAWTERANAEADQLLARIQNLRSQVGG
jgi:formiminotetrahydrofolate cyclodeaminase